MESGKVTPILLVTGFVAIAAVGVALLVTLGKDREKIPDATPEQTPKDPKGPKNPSHTAVTSYGTPKLVVQVGEVVRGTPLEHTFLIPNNGTTDLNIKKVEPGGRAEVVEFDEVVPPSSEGKVLVRWETKSHQGIFMHPFVVNFAGDRKPLILELRGKVVSPLHWTKNRLYFLDVTRGTTMDKETFLVNNTGKSVAVKRALSTNPLFEPKLEKLEDGKRFKLTVTLSAEAPVGKHSASIEIVSDDETDVIASLKTRANVYAPVSFKPPRADFGTIRRRDLDRKPIREKTVVVRSSKKTDFQVLEARTDLSFAEVNFVPDKVGQSYLVTVKLLTDETQVGEFAGTLFVKTNDPDFSELQVPVEGTLL